MIGYDMACAVCAYALNIIEDGERFTYEHPVATEKDHDPKPVPAHELPAVFRRCHFCSLHEPVWEYRTETIEALIDGPRPTLQTYSCRWHACYPCSALIDEDDSDGLTRRGASVMGWRSDEPSSAILGALYRTVVLTREPGKTLLTTTGWAPAELRAATMPKIRDRVAALLRGPHGLPAPLTSRHRRAALADGLDRAHLYWIDPEFTALVAEVHGDLPATTITDRIVPNPNGLLFWPQPVEARHHISAASWTAHPGGWDVLCYRSVGADLSEALMPRLRHDVGWLLPIHAVHVPYGATVAGGDPLAALVTAWLLIAQELAASEPAAVEPKIRKSYARAGRTPPDVRLVRIKATASSAPADTGRRQMATGGRAKPDHRFWVSEHERQQPYGPGRSLRRLITVEPFLKGPEELPIKASSTVRILGTSKGRREDAAE